MIIGTTLFAGVSAELMEVAQVLGRSGERIALLSHTEPRLRQFQTRLLVEGIDCEVFAADVTDPTAVLKAFKMLGQWSVRLDRFIYNVSMASSEPATELTEFTFHRVMSTNFLGFVNCFQLALPMFKRTGGGHVVAIPGGIAPPADGEGVAYAASKASMQIYLSALRRELAGENIFFSELHLRTHDRPEILAGFTHVLDHRPSRFSLGNKP
jgi:short-subunit dehydrogenase